jgi:signal transduction histidine kinase
MKFANETFFLVSAILLGGLFVSFLPHLTATRHSEKPNYYWLISLGLMSCSFGVFSIAPITNISLLVLANTLFLSGYIYLGIFSRSLNQPIEKKLLYVAPVWLVIFAMVFEYLRRTGTYYDRVSLVVGMTAICLLWILYELLKSRRKIRSIQLNFLICTTVAELFFALARIYLVLTNTMPSSIHIYEEPFISALIRWMWIACTALSYVAIIGFFTEKLAYENAKNIEDNLRIAALLQERETLIGNLLKANKTAATGALSASIAHELNQPLGASNLNIQFLRVKLDKGLLSSEIGKEVLDALESDNNRAANIVRSLRSIFTEGEGRPQDSDPAKLMANVLDVVRPELKAKHIQIQLRLEEGLSIKVNAGEIEQVILNLLNNAIQSLVSIDTTLRTIVIELERDGESARLGISDNGGGVPNEFKSNLFELLSTTKNSGMGLGLWLCKHIVTRYDGEIWYEEAAGGGAQFYLTLPLSGLVES